MSRSCPGLDERLRDYIRPSPSRTAAGDWPTDHNRSGPAADRRLDRDQPTGRDPGGNDSLRAGEHHPGEPILVYPASPLIYVAADRPNPTRFAHLYSGIASAEQIQQIITALQQQAVRMIIVSDAELAYWGPPGVNQSLEAYIAQNYRAVARFGAYRILLRA